MDGRLILGRDLGLVGQLFCVRGRVRERFSHQVRDPKKTDPIVTEDKPFLTDAELQKWNAAIYQYHEKIEPGGSQ